MNELDEQQWEAELRRLTPARPPEEFMARLRAARPEPAKPAARPLPVVRGGWDWRWLAPALGMAVVVAGLSLGLAKFTTPVAAAAGWKPDDVQVNEELVSSYEVVAQLPGGEPVRFRCRQLRDQMVVRDKVRGVEIETSSPRVEVTPVRFETY